MMTENTVITALMRPRCRMALGTPDETGSNWKQLPPTLVPQTSAQANYLSSGLTPPHTEIRAMADDHALYVRFDCTLEDPARLKPRVGSVPLSELERAWLHIHPHNDPVERFRFEADFKGVAVVFKQQRINGERSLGAVPDLWSHSATASIEWRAFHGFNAKAWWVEMEIPWDSLGLPGRPAVIGFECGRAYNTGLKGMPMDDLSWPDPKRESTCETGLEPGEALIGFEVGTPEKLELNPPRFGKNTGSLSLVSQWHKRPASLHVRTEAVDGKLVGEQKVPISSPPRSVEFEYWLDRSLCSHLDVFGPQRLVIELKADDGMLLYGARLPMDRHLGICIDEPYGERARIEPIADRVVTRREMMLEQVARKLPRLHRRNTAQGAPSDFCLMHEDGRLAVNLIADDAWPKLAAIVEQCCHSTESRLIGAMLLAGQKSVTNLFLCHLFFDAKYEATYKHGNLHDKMGPLSIARYGGGPAVARAAVLARLLQQIQDPATGKPFVTRVLSLQKDGGPKLADRHNPFWQKAGPVGAVAVEYGGDHTILDPTTLAAFVKSDGKLATLDEMLADEKLRTEGAGKMAPVFAKIDADEVHHEQPNRLLSKGVFPELCPDEDRPDTPFDPRERQVLRTIIASDGKESTPLEGFTDTYGKRGKRDGSVAVRWDKETLGVRVTVRGVSLASLQGVDREREEIHLALDVKHDHFNFRHLMISAAGVRKLWAGQVSNIQTLFKHLSTEQSTNLGEIADVAWNASIESTTDGYCATFEVPWKLLRVKQVPAAIGLNVWVQGRAPVYEQVFLSPPRWHIAPDPFHFADLYLNDTPVTVGEIDLGIPTWGDNIGRATLVNHSDREIAITLQVEDWLGKRRFVTRSREVTMTVPARGTSRVEFPYLVNGEEKMGAPQRLQLITKSAGKEFFHATWHVDYCGPVSAYYRYGSQVDKADNPRPGEPDFLQKKIRYICGRIPDFKRVTTRDGAASDFVLRAEDGSAEFNLMQAGVLDTIGDYIAKRFDNDLDRILGIYYFSHAPFYARHMSWGHRIMEGADPLSVTRGNFAGGGGNCGYHSRVFGGLACHLKLNGEYLVAHGSVPVFGHVISAVARRGSKALMDADVGHFFLTPDGTDLATIEEVRANPGILTTASPGDLARYYTVDDDAVRIRKTMLGQKVKGSFPPGAPQE